MIAYQDIDQCDDEIPWLPFPYYCLPTETESYYDANFMNRMILLMQNTLGTPFANME